VTRALAPRSRASFAFSALTLSALALPGTADLAHAQGYSDPFDLEGRIALGYAANDRGALDSTAYVSLDAEGRFHFDPDRRVGLGFDMFALNESDTDTLDYYDIYLFYDFGAGEIQLGRSPSAIELFLPERSLRFGGADQASLLVEVAGQASGLRQISYGNDPALGLSYFGDYGTIEAGLSAHYDTDGDGQIYALSGLYHITDTVQLFAGTEFAVDTGTDLDHRIWMGGRYDDGWFTVHGILSNGVGFDADNTTFELGAEYALDAIPGLSVGGDITMLNLGGGSETLARVGAEYIGENGLGLGGHATVFDDTAFWGLEASVNF